MVEIIEAENLGLSQGKKIRHREIVSLSEDYIELYKKLVLYANPNIVEEFLNEVGAYPFAKKMRLKRIKKKFDKKLVQLEEQAQALLSNIINMASEKKNRSISQNKWYIGNITRLKADQEFQAKKVAGIINDYDSDIEFLKKNGVIKISSDYFDWTGINPDPARLSEEISIEKRVYYDQLWKEVKNQIALEKEIATEIRVSEYLRWHTNMIEQLCSISISNAKEELEMSRARFASLEIAFSTTEWLSEVNDSVDMINKIESFLITERHGKALIDFNREAKRLSFEIEEDEKWKQKVSGLI